MEETVNKGFVKREYPKWQAIGDLSPTNVGALLKGEPYIIRFALRSPYTGIYNFNFKNLFTFSFIYGKISLYEKNRK